MIWKWMKMLSRKEPVVDPAVREAAAKSQALSQETERLIRTLKEETSSTKLAHARERYEERLHGTR